MSSLGRGSGSSERAAGAAARNVGAAIAAMRGPAPAPQRGKVDGRTCAGASGAVLRLRISEVPA